MIFVTSTESKDKISWRWYGCFETCSSTYNV